jgi:3-hydroxyisobutyrate dehydrogenase
MATIGEAAMRIAVIGTGLMGAALAEVLLKSGHDVVVYNRTPAKLAPLIALGAFAAATPGEAIAQAEATFLVLTDAACMEQVLLSDETRPALAG